MPATADLLTVIASLPRGAVVLPGLDTQADPIATWRAIALDPSDPDFPLAQAHPQFGLARLLRRAGPRTSRDVRPWPAPECRARRWGGILVDRALAPAARVGGDARSARSVRALNGLSMIETTSKVARARGVDPQNAGARSPGGAGDPVRAGAAGRASSRWASRWFGGRLAQSLAASRLVARMAIEDWRRCRCGVGASRWPRAGVPVVPRRVRAGLLALRGFAAPGFAGPRRVQRRA